MEIYTYKYADIYLFINLLYLKQALLEKFIFLAGILKQDAKQKLNRKPSMPSALCAYFQVPVPRKKNIIGMI